jgi:Outer membrane protein beta-barrel domain
MKNTTHFFFSTLLLLLLSASLSTTYAQSRQRWSLGPRAGLNLSNFRGDVQNTKILPGFYAGIGVIYSDDSRFGFSLDALYSQRGAKFEVGANQFGGPYSATVRVNYLEVPVLARYFLNDGGSFRPNVFLGPSLGLRLGAKTTNKTYNSTVDSKDFYNAAEVGLTGGVQLNFRVADRQRLTVDARYTLGLTDITTDATTVRNSTISVGVGYNFGVGRQYRRGDRKIPVRVR